jgi:hypothetical protein
MELELGVTGLPMSVQMELSRDFPCKKPYRLSDTTEFMLDAGPSLCRTFTGYERGTTLSAEAVLDFMFWGRKDIGSYLKPGWSTAPNNGQ